MHPLHVDDDVFVRAPRQLVYRRVTDVASWPAWWRGVTVERQPDRDGRETWFVEARRDRRRSLRLLVSLHAFRHDTGVAMALTGDVTGQAEFWIDARDGGVVLHHVLSGRTADRPLSTLATYRRVVRRGMFGLKDAVQTEVRTAIGLRP